MSSWLIFLAKNHSFSGSIFSSVRTDLGRPEFSFRATSPVSSIFFNSLFTPFTFHSYSGWSLTILLAPYRYFIRTCLIQLIITFCLYENTISLVTNNLIYIKRKTDLERSWCQLISTINLKVSGGHCIEAPKLNRTNLN